MLWILVFDSSDVFSYEVNLEWSSGAISTSVVPDNSYMSRCKSTLAKTASVQPYIGPEPALPVTRNAVQAAIR